MTPELSLKQTLFVWVLLFTGQEPSLSKAKPKIFPKERAQLIDAGLIRLDKRGKSTHLVLTDKAWGWAAEHLDAPFSLQSLAAAPALGGLLKRLKTFLEIRHLALADFLNPRPLQPKPDAGAPVPGPAPAAASSLEAAAVRAYLQASGSVWNVWVKLADIRKRLPDVPRADLDRELLRLEKTGRAILYPIEDPEALRPEDESAALLVAGFKRHILRMRS